MDTEIGVISAIARGKQLLPEATSYLKRLRASGGSEVLLTTWFQTSDLQSSERINVLFKHPICVHYDSLEHLNTTGFENTKLIHTIAKYN